MRKFNLGDRVYITEFVFPEKGTIKKYDEDFGYYIDFDNKIYENCYYEEGQLEKIYNEDNQKSWINNTKEYLGIKRYIINKNATIIFWEDGNKTIVKLNKKDKYNKRLGFLTAYFQKMSGMSKTKANKYLDSLEEENE